MPIKSGGWLAREQRPAQAESWVADPPKALKQPKDKAKKNL